MNSKLNFIKNISAISKTSPQNGNAICRKKHGFNIRVTGSMEYNFDGKKFLVNEGEMIFLPKGASYTYEVKSKGYSRCTIITMDADFDEDAHPTVYPLKDLHCAQYIMHHFSDSWNFGSNADKYRCISYLYELLAFMDNYNSLKYMKERKFHIIDPALDYLKTHIYDTDLKTDNLAHLCGISNTYFRKIFALRFKTSPKDYITEKRLARAKAIIDSGEFHSVKELAHSVGYDDPMYFGKVFKKYFAMPPATMNKL